MLDGEGGAWGRSGHRFSVEQAEGGKLVVAGPQGDEAKGVAVPDPLVDDRADRVGREGLERDAGRVDLESLYLGHPDRWPKAAGHQADFEVDDLADQERGPLDCEPGCCRLLLRTR